MTRRVQLQDLGAGRAYKEIWALQEMLLQQKVQQKQAGAGSNTYDYLLFVEHNPVYTLGKSGAISNVLISDEERQRRGIEFYKINRGGDITFHGPGQLVGYPIMDLDHYKTDLGWYLRSLEEVIIMTMDVYGLKGERSSGETGVWLDAGTKGLERKICAMGIRCSRWVTMHGFALNVNTDLDYFGYIIPCGIQNKQVTSLQKELRGVVDIARLKQVVTECFEKVFGVEVVAANDLTNEAGGQQINDQTH